MVQLRKCIREWESILQQMRCVCVCIPILHPFENGFSRWISIKVTKIWMFPKIRVPPKSSMLIGFSFISHPFWGTPILGNPHVHVLFNFLFLFFVSVAVLSESGAAMRRQWPFQGRCCGLLSVEDHSRWASNLKRRGSDGNHEKTWMEW